MLASSNMLLLLLRLGCALGAVGAALSTATESPVAGQAVCDQVQQLFVMKGIGSAQMVAPTPVSGLELKICRAESTCCTQQTEDKYREAVHRDFLSIMHTTSASVKNLISNNAVELQDTFLRMVQASSNSTRAEFSGVYPRMAPEARDSIAWLYRNVRDHLQGREIDLEETVGGFFDSLFPLVYHRSINPKLRELDREYKECLQASQAELRPFADVPRQVGVQVARAAAAARTLLQALQLGERVLDATEHAPITAECADALLRLTYCPLCRGLVHVKPCNGYCVNVVRGCLAHAAELDQPWNDYVATLDRYTLGMRGDVDLENVLEQLGSRISEAIMHAMENGPQISRKVRKACGQPKRAVVRPSMAVPEAEQDGVDWSSTPSSVATEATSSTANSLTLYKRLRKFVASLSSSKGFYSTLAETLCTDDHLAVGKENNCWNGHTIGEYAKTIVGLGVSAQKYNPEMNTSKTIDENVIQLIEKLKNMRHMLMASITPLPETDIMLNDGSGSGHSSNNFNDVENYDEDYDTEGSGSGNGDQHPTSSRDWQPPGGRPSPKKETAGAGSGITIDEDVDNDHSNTIDVSHHQGVNRPNKDGKSGNSPSSATNIQTVAGTSVNVVSTLAAILVSLRIVLSCSG